MNVAEKRRRLIAQLEEHLANLDKSISGLVYSFDKCVAIGGKAEYDLEEQESFEALTSRFARTSDILTQKVFKSLFILLQENVKTAIDAANCLEKLEIIENAEDLLNVRELRNQIAHEYVESNLKDLFSDVLRYVPELKKIVNNTKTFVNNQVDRLKTEG